MRCRGPQWSYQKHIEAERLEELPLCVSKPNSVDAWLHHRALNLVLPILAAYPKATWMTVGDGKYGSDAYFLRGHGADVLSTSLTDHTLSIAEQKGLIDRFRCENAERICANDESFDFVLCKEAYHHFPRPPIAFYEMLRVARQAVILIEPREGAGRLLNHMKQYIKRRVRGVASTLFERGGNFIFRVNEKEVVKMMAALNHGVVFCKRFNTFYHPRLAVATMSSVSLPGILTRLAIAIQDVLSVLRLLDYGGTCVMVFKEMPCERLQQDLRRQGFQIMAVPANPYLSHEQPS